MRANTTIATPVHAARAGPGEQYTLRGHKWFTSAPMSDAFLTLAQTEAGVSCFLVPRWLPDGTRNLGLRISRLKDKIGDKSNASSEVEYHNAWGVLIGPLGRGVRTIVEMVVHTRLDCTIGSAALMRQSAMLAAQHASGRSAFGRSLLEAPLMRSVLADLAVETEAANATWSRMARAFDGAAADDEHERSLRRIATAVGKYYVCKRAPQVAYEAMECLGGNGYVEDGPMARLYRQAPLNSIWEGSGNVICLDILRALRAEPESAAALLTELHRCRGADSRLDGMSRNLSATLSTAGSCSPSELEASARLLVDQMAVALQAASLLTQGNEHVAKAYCASRLPPRTGGVNYGAVRSADDFGGLEAQSALIDRLTPA